MTKLAKQSTDRGEQTDWHPEDVKAAIRKTGISLSQLAVQHGYSVSALSMTLRRRSPEVQGFIGRHLGILPQKIWPTRYDDLGQPLDRRRSAARIHNNGRVAADSQKQEAA